MMNNPLLDSDFLKDLSENYERTVYARIVALDIKEQPTDEISGRVTQGSITIDGNSSVRRSFSLTLIPGDTLQGQIDKNRAWEEVVNKHKTEIRLDDYYWGLSTKVRLYIGLKNSINPDYPDIIWFKQGTFILSAFNTSQSVNNYTVSIQGKDKMCMLNGEMGGMIESLTADFGKVKVETRDKDGKLEIIEEDVPIKTIIKEAVHKYGNEPFQNIIVNDLDDYGLELMEYRGDEEKPMYLLINEYSGESENIKFDGSSEYLLYENEKYTKTPIRLDSPNFKYDPRVGISMGADPDDVTRVYVEDASSTNNGQPTVYTVSKITYGETCGYRLTDLTFAGDLTAKVGDSITSILDKIKNMLGDFEYFYDIDGHFIFQRKKTYTMNKWNGIISDGIVDTYVKVKLTEDTYEPGIYYVRENNQYLISNRLDFNPVVSYYEKIDGARTSSAVETSPISYFFGNSNLVTSFNNTPNLSNLKNDFSIWGSRKSANSEKQIPIHLRYAVDKKPVEYTSYDGTKKFTVRPYEEILEEVTNKYHAQKTPNPNGLPEDWWDVHEWAEFYRIRTGAFPVDTIGTYCNPINIRLRDYFNVPDGKWYSGEVTHTDDIFYDIATNTVTDIHGVCAHDYQYYIRLAQNGIGAYIHKPQIPDVIISGDNKDTVFDNDLKIVTNLDWRELIYQMAIDYNANCHNDDFALKIYQNNEGIFNEDGTTGYEAYYTDMEGFWRTLYNSHPEAVGDIPDDSIPFYYTWDEENEVYIQTPFEDCVSIKSLPARRVKLYQLRGATYYELHRRDDFRYYAKNRQISLMDLLEDKTYYTSTAPGNYEKWTDNSSFDIGRKYYTYTGYKRVNMLERGKTYYTRTEVSEGQYTYTKALEIQKDGEYFVRDLGIKDVDYIKVQVFARGNQYYTLDEEGNYQKAFLYENDTIYYEDKGYETVLDLTECTSSDRYFIDEVQEDGEIVVKEVTTSLPRGSVVNFYKHVPSQHIENGRYYTIQSETTDGKTHYSFLSYQVICNFEMKKVYYELDGDEFVRYNIYNFKDNVRRYDNQDYNINTGWAINVTQDPSNLIFWFDFLDTDGEVAKYSVRAVGNRPKAVNDDNVKSIYYRETPCVIFVNADNWEKLRDVKPGYTYVKLNKDIENLFHISSQGKTAHAQLETFLYNFTYCTESISMTTIPVYHLQPNTRVSVRDDNSHINGEYLINRLTIPLTYNGTMNISAIKAADTIY